MNIIPLPVSVTTSSVPNSYVPPEDMQELLEAVPQFTSYALNDSGAAITINNNAAGAALEGLWIWDLTKYKLPDRAMTGYRNGWWPIYTGITNEVRMLVAFWNSYFDSSGRGIHGSGWDGWCLCNGQNGTVNLAQRFVIPGYRWAGGGWVTNVIGIDAYAGGSPRTFSIQYINLPLITLYLVATNFYKWARFGSGQLSTVATHGEKATDKNGSPKANYTTWFYPLDQSPNMQSQPISRIPPYIAVGYAQFMGYL